MSPRPIYHWKSFWLGVFVMCFLGWGWWSSYRESPAFLWAGRERGIFILRVEGMTCVTTGPSDELGTGYPLRDWAMLSVEQAHGWEERWEESRWGAPDAVRCDRVPDAMVFFPFLALWGGWLAWWGRVKGKMARSMEGVAMESGTAPRPSRS